MTAGRTASVAVIGGGPAGLIAAEALAGAGASVTVYDRMPTLGRKFLMAGRGGLNLTHSEPFPRFLERYPDLPNALRVALTSFPPDRLRAWCENLGQPTFVGSSGRVFPVALKASPLLRAWLRRLNGAGVRVALRHRWTGWSVDGALTFETGDRPVEVRPDATILALGGASWPGLGSDGTWAASLQNAGLEVQPFAPSNCGVLVEWSPIFRERFEGQPLKNVALRIGSASARGDVVVTRTGLEGGPVYALSAPLRKALERSEPVGLCVLLRPDLPLADIERRLAARKPQQSLATALRKTLNLSPVAIGLLREGGDLHAASNSGLAKAINGTELRVIGLSGLDRAISTAGGLRFGELDDHLMMRHRPGVFCAGEMLDWDAPTGGYLLQGCFATGFMAGRGASAWLGL